MFSISKILATTGSLAPGTFVEKTKFLASDYNNVDLLGSSVSINTTGNLAIVGSAYDDATNTNQGSAYIVTKSIPSNTWTEQAKLVASDPIDSANFGYSVSISGDGTTAIVGAAGNARAAYIFINSGGSWSQQAKLTGDSSGYFGWAVLLSSDGNTAFVSDPYYDDSPLTDSGTVYVFTRSGVTWTQVTPLLTASDKSASASFGISLALSKNNNFLIVGANGDSDGKGAAYVFTNGGSGSTYTEQTKLTADDKQNGDQFGASVATSYIGDVAVIGAKYESTTPTTSNGAAYVFTRSNTTWTQRDKLLSNSKVNAEYFGSSVAVSNDGAIAAIGATNESEFYNNGNVYVFARTTASSWAEKQKITSSDFQSGDNFGVSVALSGPGSTLVVGAPKESTSPKTTNGAAYFFSA